MENLKKLDPKDLREISGGWNLIEYIAMGVGYVAGVMSNIEKHTSVSPIHNNWAHK